MVFAVFGTDDAEGDFRDGVAEGFPVRGGVEGVHELFGAGKRPVDDVDVVDFGPAQHERETDVPFRLLARAENGDAVDVRAAVEDHGGGESCAEGGEFFGGEKGVREAG